MTVLYRDGVRHELSGAASEVRDELGICWHEVARENKN